MHDPMVLIVGREAKVAAQEAARAAFPAAQVVMARDVGEAAKIARPGGHHLLVLVEPDEMEIARAAQATDGDSLPRWAAVVVGRGPSDLLECVSLEEGTVELVGRVFRSALQQHELMCENLRLRGDLKTVARRIRHDLLSPVNCIGITCELMKEMLGENAGAVEGQVGVIAQSLAEISYTIERVSDLLNASAEPPPVTALSMSDLVASVLIQLEGELQEKSIRFEHPPTWPEVAGVPSWIEAIWWNLIKNAVRHNQAAAPILLGWAPTGESFRFWVANRGEALPPEAAEQLFPRFDQLHAQPSAGLGLSLVQRLVSIQGGRCGYERMNNDYSSFYFTLPAQSA